MAAVAAFKRLKAALTPTQSSTDLYKLASGEPHKASIAQLFPKTDPSIDGDDCLHDCATCTVHYPAKFSIDEDDKLYGHVNGWSTHVVVATGKTDWVRDVADEKGSVMEAVGNGDAQPKNGKLMLSASNIPLPYCPADTNVSTAELPTTLLLLPAFIFIDNVKPSSVPELVDIFINNAPTNISPLSSNSSPSDSHASTKPRDSADEPSAATATGHPIPTPSVSSPSPPSTVLADDSPTQSTTLRKATPPKTTASLLSLTSPSGLTARPCPHRHLILLCSQKTRDARCGQSAPLLLREFSRHLRPLGLYRDLNDERPGGVGIYFISHVGGHKYSANVMVYRRGEEGSGSGTESAEASQCIWLARVRPEDCENIVRYTVLQGKVVKPERQLRGGFDRERGLVSW